MINDTDEATLIVEVCTIDKIVPAKGFDRLEFAIVKGWQCLVGKGLYTSGDLCIFIPPDAIIPPQLEERVFSNAKIKLKNGRIEPIKLKGLYSQGLVVPISYLEETGVTNTFIGMDVKDILGIVKYEPKVKEKPKGLDVKTSTSGKWFLRSNFIEYPKIHHFQNFPFSFSEGEVVHISEKIHGTSFRCGYITRKPKGFIQNLKKLLAKHFKMCKKLWDDKEFVYGSRKVDLSDIPFEKIKETAFYKENVYGKTVKQYNLKAVCEMLSRQCRDADVLIFGEIYGPSIQKGYHYGLDNDEIAFRVYDIMLNNMWVEPSCLDCFLPSKIETVPQIAIKPFNEDEVTEYLLGLKSFCTKQKVPEGIVIRPNEECEKSENRRVFKVIHPEYLLRKDRTEFS